MTNSEHKTQAAGVIQSLRPIWLPTLDTLRNSFLLPTAEMLNLFQAMRDVGLWRVNDSTLGYESITTATKFHHTPHNQQKPERIAPSRVVHVPNEPYAFYEVWQKSGKDWFQGPRPS